MSRTHRHPVMLIVLAWLGLAFAATVAPHAQGKAELAFKAALDKEVVDGDLKAAIDMYRKIAQGSDRAVAARALVRMGQCYEKLGDLQASEARKAYEQVVREFGDQAATAAEARARLAALAGPVSVARRSALAVRQVWAGPDVDLEGGVSPDGRYIGFIDWGTGDLAVRDLVKQESSRLTKTGSPSYREYADFATFSPDGKQVAYGWCCNTDGNYELRLVGIDGSEPRVIHRSPDVSYFMPQGWSRDGKQILSLVGQKNDTRIALVSVADGSIRALKPVGRRFRHACLSPDGRWLVFDYAEDESLNQRDIYLLAVDRTREVRLVEHPADDSLPLWTPDGKQILFVSDRGGTPGLWRVSVVDGQAQGLPQLLKPDVGRIRPFDIVASGSVYYGLTAGTGEVYEAGIDPKSGRLVSPPSPAMKHYVGFNGTPDYSPDGQSLACLSSRGSSKGHMLIIRSQGTGEEREFPLGIAVGFRVEVVA